MSAGTQTMENGSAIERLLVLALEEWLVEQPTTRAGSEPASIEDTTQAEQAALARVSRAVAAETPRDVVTLQVPTRADPDLDPDSARVAPAAGEASASAPNHPLAVLDRVVEELATLAATDWHALSGAAGHEALDRLEHIRRLTDGVRTRALSAVDQQGLWAVEGARTFPAWLRQRTGSTAGAASREVREARALRDHLPLAAEALATGKISAQHVSVLVREALTTEQLRAQLREAELGEEFLVTEARRMDAGTFTRLVKAWAISADPEAADRSWREQDAKEMVTLSPTLGGYHLAGWLDDTSGQLVRTALDAHMGRKGQDDDRLPSQRRAAALVSLARQSLDAGQQGAGARVRPHITVTTSLDTLRALANATGSAVPPPPVPESAVPQPGPDSPAPGPAPQTGPRAGVGPPEPADSAEPTRPPGRSTDRPAEDALNAPGGPRDPQAPAVTPQDPFELSAEARSWVEDWQPGDPHVMSTAIDPDVMRGTAPATLEDGTPIPPAMLARLVCESGLSRVVFGPASTVLDVGREKRIFPANQTRAIIARDRHCQYPGCDEPPGFGEIHHSIWWAKDNGPTSVEHGILLCWHHHDWVHIHQVTITRAHGSWHFTDRHGRPIAPAAVHRR